jgi:putative hydrolase
MNYQMTFDYHTHTAYSHGLTPWTPHGKGTIMENAVAAAAKGLSAIAISDHGPGHMTYGIKLGNLPQVRKEIEQVKRKVPGLDIFLSVEANIRSGSQSLDLTTEEAKAFDFLLGGYHLAVRHAFTTSNYFINRGIFANEKNTRRAMVRNTEMVIRALFENNLRILTHPGDKAPVDILEIAKACGETDTWMEISNFHSHLALDEIKVAASTNALFVISSDAHRPERIGSFEKGLNRALKAGLDPSRIVNIKESREL